MISPFFPVVYSSAIKKTKGCLPFIAGKLTRVMQLTQPSLGWFQTDGAGETSGLGYYRKQMADCVNSSGRVCVLNEATGEASVMYTPAEQGIELKQTVSGIIAENGI
ncbi:hypothetical protein HPP92_009083 [Vanilla planifolia]|uniref:Uncharacterized protein n=1 Tax=Vanilla planifolia TaxID=51239 RepID=A0A835V2I9_VANPL|nr:hypothetical protein HPP92_009083 [Vanilla planifolia]